MLGGRLIAAAVAAAAVSAPLADSAAGAPSVLVHAATPRAADSLGPGARPALPAASVAALARRAGRPLPELRRLYRLGAGGPPAARRLARRLDGRPGLEAVAVAPPPPPPAVCRAAPPGGWPAFGPGDTPDLAPLQDYREGLGIPAGADGQGVRIADVEYEWRRTHEELADRDLPAPVLTPGGLDPSYRAEDHGTAVLGVLGGDADGRGVTGLAPAAELLPRAPFFAPRPDVYDPLRAVMEAALDLRPGDVLLIEQQVDLGSGSPVLAPVEALAPMRDLIRAVVDSGIVVVEPAGNGDRDLAGLNLPWLADADDPGHSGALMVGAGDSPSTGVDKARTPGTNWGARVDVQGYGSGVLTSGYGQGLGPTAPADRLYTSCFDGTSSASATVAGAIAALQGLARGLTGEPLAPDEVRTLLVATAAPPPSPTSQPVGPRPDVAAAAGLIAPAEPDTPAAAPPPPAPAAGPLVPAPPPARTATRPAARRAIARIDRRDGTVTITLRGAAPRVVAFVGGRRAPITRGRIVLLGVKPRRFLLVVGAAPRPGVAYVSARFLVVVPARGPARARRL